MWSQRLSLLIYLPVCVETGVATTSLCFQIRQRLRDNTHGYVGQTAASLGAIKALCTRVRRFACERSRTCMYPTRLQGDWWNIFFLKMMKYFIIIIISTEFVWFKNNNYSLLLNWLFVAFLWLFGSRFWLISVRKSLVVLPCGRQNFS
jgi:hypothetical protein